MKSNFILAKLTTVFTMDRTFGNKLNRDWTRRYGIIFITLIFQVIFCEGQYPRPTEVCQDPYNLIDYNFDPTREICCEGKVFDNAFQEYDCHRSSSGHEFIFLRNEEFFCGDQKLKIQGERGCCGDVTYDRAVSSCCEGQLLPKQENMECCGTELMNSTRKTCCYGSQIVDGLGECCGRNTLYNPNTQVCISDTVYNIPSDGNPYSFYSLCNQQLYDVEKEICCDGSVSEKRNMVCYLGQYLYDPAEKAFNEGTESVQDIVDGKTRSCGSQMYNPNVEVCCPSSRVTYVGSANGACCAGKAYSKDNASCCAGVITKGVPEIPGIQACSGTVSYLTSRNISCSLESVNYRYSSGKVACCGGEVYFPSDSVCCMGVIRNKFGKGVCCGTDVLGPNQHCINDEIVRGKEGDDMLCKQYPATYNGDDQMLPRVIPYNSKLFICKKGALVVKKPKMEYCEGSGKIYNTDTELCCGNNKVFSKQNEWGLKTRCCGYESYYPGRQSCHHTQIYHFPEKFAVSCGSFLFDNRSHVCIGNHIFAKNVTHLTPANCRDAGSLRAFNQSCCQGKLINDVTQLCCNNRVYSKHGMEDASCCSSRVHDNASSQCCDGSLHRREGVNKTCVGRLAVADYEQVCGNMVYNKTDGECCGNGLFNLDIQLCCNEVRIEKESQNDKCCGTTKYDTSESKICCSDAALYNERDGFQCCGSSLINPSHSICINDQYVIDKKFEEGTCSVSVTDDPTGTCCAGIKHVQKFGVCDGIYLNEGRDFYGNELREEVEDTLSQCGDESYNEATHTCCNRKVIKNGIKICCDNKIWKVTERGENSCCVRKPYNNESSICCGRRIVDKSDIQSAADAEGCCADGQKFHIKSGLCKDREEEVCSLCQDSRRSKDNISRLACGALHHLTVRVTRTISRTNSLAVKVSPLSKDCQRCPTSLDKSEMKRLKQLLLPENSNCECAKGKYVLLSSGQLDEGRLLLQSSDVLLPYRTAKIVRKALKNDCASSGDVSP